MIVNDKRYGKIPVSEATAKFLKENGQLVEEKEKKNVPLQKELKERKTKEIKHRKTK